MVAETPIVDAAPAKINLYLHVTGKRTDGYHLLDSLVVLADVGDQITATPSDILTLDYTGPFAKVLPPAKSNLVLHAAERLKDAFDVSAGAALKLNKALPMASGIGGGSADAAATLRALCALVGFGCHAPKGRGPCLVVGRGCPRVPTRAKRDHARDRRRYTPRWPSAAAQPDPNQSRRRSFDTRRLQGTNQRIFKLLLRCRVLLAMHLHFMHS